MQIFHWKPDLLLVSIFVISLIDVHQIARKKESVFKDLDIIQLTWIEMDNWLKWVLFKVFHVRSFI